MSHETIQPQARVAVMGAGSWGTTVAKIFADSNCPVRLWVRRPGLARDIQASRCNADYLPGIPLPDSIEATADAAYALQDADLVIFAVPSQTLRENLRAWVDYLDPAMVLVSLAKGIENNTLDRMSEIILEETQHDPDLVCVLSGPNLAREIADEQLAASVVACPSEATAWAIQHLVTAPYFRIYTNTDVIGCEIAGACKNIIALACGMAVGAGLGENTVAAVMTRGLDEVTRLGLALGAAPATFAGLAGIGDLVATCASPLSRNRTFGARLGSGATLAEAKLAANHSVAEGVYSSKSVQQLAAQYGVEMPIVQAVYDVCHQGVSVASIQQRLMNRQKRSEKHQV